jgi:alpha-beta hydrolase superfamily lysophospholipase
MSASALPGGAAPKAPAPHRVSHRTSTFAGRRGRVHYHRWSAPGRPAAVLILLHGLGEHGGQYAPLGEAAAAIGVETWAPDHAGHGRSDGERVLIESIDDLVADADTLLAVARAANPGVPVVVVGHSLGATVAALLVGEIRAGADPAADAAGLVLAGSSLLPAAGATEGSTGGLAALLAAGVDPMDLRKDPGELVRDPEQAQRVRDDPLVWAGGLRPQTLAALGAAGVRTHALVVEGALDHLPVLVLHGGADDLAPVAGAVELAQRLPRARIVVFDEDRHNVLHELDRDAVHAELLRFATAVAAVPTP